MFGVEYTNEQINSALQSDDPWSIVPSRDTDGHGTFIAGVASGNRIEDNNFSGVAPLSDICVVKCKQAKQTLKRYYRIDTDAVCYAEQDIMMGVRYLWNVAISQRKPLVICIGIGTSMGGHNRGGILGEFLESIGDYRGVAVVTSCGNEANTGHHYRSKMIEPGGDIEVELRVGSNAGFTMELWGDAPNLYAIGIISPSGEYSGKTVAKLGEKRQVNFVLEDTVVDLEYLLIAYESGDECIQMRFRSPAEGIWKIRVFNENQITGFFDIWLPIQNFLPKTTYFLESNPDVTLCDPSNNITLISTAFYDSYQRSVAVDSSRGYTRTDYIKPDLAAPGIDVYGPLQRLGNAYPVTEEERILTARYGYQSGSSAATALTSGAAALLLEWGIVKNNDITMDTVTIQKYLIRGVDAKSMTEPNRLWGNGTLDLYGVFESLRPRL